MNSGSGSHWRSDKDLFLEIKPDFAGFNIPAKFLNIVWGKNRRYWDWIDISQEARLEGFEQGAVLHQVNWLEVVGSLKVASKTRDKTKCQIYYIVKFRVDAFGWDSVPIKFKVNAGGVGDDRTEDLEQYTRKNDVWHEINGGEFSVPAGETVSLSFGMIENRSEWWKGGMILAGVKIKLKLD